MNIRTGLLIILLLVAGAFQNASAQIELRSSVIGSGGIASSTDNGLAIISTVGQPVAGMSENVQGTGLSSGFWHTSFEIVTSVEQVQDGTLPTDFRLEQNYPNPFNPTTTIAFSVPKASQVSLKLYDVFGRLISILVDEKHQPGTYRVTFTASDLASGVYVYRIEAEGFEQTRKLTLLK